MVLFKRKPIQYLPPPKIENDETEVWEIKQTGEIFIDYESYLARIDFYRQRRFICQITGHSGLSFFEALKSEHAGAQEIEEAFPEALKGPILRRVQFQTISRIDTLVDLIFEEFRTDYYPGEIVIVSLFTGERLTGVVRDKTSFGAKILPDGIMKPPFSRYFVSLDNRPKEEVMVDDAHISRDRKIFTKQVLRSFIKKSVTRESWTGAPWQVKHEVAKKYHIDIRVPPHLLYENKVNRKKTKISLAKSGSSIGGKAWNSQGNPSLNGRLLELKPTTETQNSRHLINQQSTKYKKQKSLHPYTQKSHPMHSINHHSFISHTFQVFARPSQAESNPVNFLNSTFTITPSSKPQLTQPLPQVKYPIDDLQVPIRKGDLKRPAFKFLSYDTPQDNLSLPKKPGREERRIEMNSVGLLLESWDMLNVFCEVFVLDSFTFDDFVEAMQLSSENVFECELFNEIHCAALKMLVASEADGGKILVPFLDIKQDKEIDEDRSEPIYLSASTFESEQRPIRTTRSSFAKFDVISSQKYAHHAAEIQAEINWIDELRKRNFREGGWQFILVGLLYQLSKSLRYFDVCEILLSELAPLELDLTPQTVRYRYSHLNINLRVQILQILCMLSVETQAIRNYMEECSEQMTSFRKEKVQCQRDRKLHLEELRLLNEERKLLFPSNMPSSPINESKAFNKSPECRRESNISVEDNFIDTNEDFRVVHSLRRGEDRAIERKKKREAQQQRKRKAALDSKQFKNKKFSRLLKELHKKEELVAKCESEIATLDNDLREADCPRTRLLGRDRFWNRYFWFERNSMPYGGLPDSSTAHADYANGCIWIQGPGNFEREGFIDMQPELQNEYMKKFHMTTLERKRKEEGITSVYNAYQWGYYEDPESVDELILWLDNRGSNELKLQKELNLYRDQIVRNMEKRKNYLQSSHEQSSESNRRHMATRQRELPLNSITHRCSAWHNRMALLEIGHLHSDQPSTQRSAKRRQSDLNDFQRVTKFESKGKNKRHVGLGQKTL